MALAITKEIKLLAKHSAVYSVGTFMQRVVALLLLPVYTRYLTPHDYGVKELVGLSTDVIAILLATSISSAFYRFYFSYEDETERNEVFSTALLSIGGIGLIAVGLLSFFSTQMAELILENSELYFYFYIAFASLLFRSINNISFSYIKAKKRSVMFICLSFIRMILVIGLNIYFVCILKIGVLGILVSGLISSFIISVVFTSPLLLRVGLKYSTKKLKDMIVYGLPLIPGQLGSFVVHLSDRFFIKEYSSIADAGLYSLGYRFGTLPGTFISDPFNQIYQPRRLEIYKREGSEYLFGQIFTYFVALICFLGLLISSLSKDLLIVMADKSFWSAYKIVPIIVVANIIFSFQSHLNFGIVISKKTKYFLYINLSNAIVVLILNYLFIPKYGIWAAAYITLFAFVYQTCLIYYFSSREYKIYFEVKRIIKIFIISIIIFKLSEYVMTSNNAINLFVKLFFVSFLYPIFLYLINFFTDAEKRKIYSTLLNFRK